MDVGVISRFDEGVSTVDNPLHTVPEADRLEQLQPADPAAGRSLIGGGIDEAWDAPEADLVEQTQPATAAVDPDPADTGDLDMRWDTPDGDRLEQSVPVAYDDEDRDDGVDEAPEGDDR